MRNVCIYALNVCVYLLGPFLFAMWIALNENVIHKKFFFFWNISHKIWIFMIVLMMFSWQLPIILTHWPKVTQSLFNLWIKKKMILIVNDHQGNLFSNFGIVWKVSFLILTFHNLLIVVVVVTLRQWNADFVEYKWREYV